MKAKYEKIFLASKSPRRQELLKQLGVDFQQIENHFDETLLPNERAKEYVERLALGKAESASKQLKTIQYPILAADTIVVLNDEILGKPKDIHDAQKMLSKLSGNKHQVLTSLVLQDRHQVFQKTSISDVTFETLNPSQIKAYCETQEPLGKAGSYAIQGLAASFIELLQGSYSGVMGLPLRETRQLLDQVGVKYLLN